MISTRSWLYTLDPRTKLWFGVLAIALLIITANLPILFAILAAAHLILLFGRVPLRQIASVWRGLLLIILIILILQPLLVPGDGPTLWRFGPIRVTEAGLLNGVRYALRLSASAFALAVLLLTTPMPSLVRAFEKIGLPYTLSMVISLALNYFGMLANLYTSISEAQQARGWDLSQRGLWKRVQAAVPTLIAVIIASLRLSDSLALGLAARGFGLNRPRTIRRDLRLSPLDWVAMLVITTLAFFAVLWIILRI